ncbi:MAG TPA: hydrogenase maturation protease [Acidimicrobiales bacterium]|nr:hydrogenase maturation protease [Acidimicrobiales bacterium]
MSGGARVLVVGVGNIFLGDDGFGVEVAARLAARPIPEGVRVADFGIRGVHLAYELLEGFDLVILVDTVNLGDAPGTVAVLEPDADSEGGVLPDAHDLDPVAVLGLLTDLGGSVGRMLVVGCQPSDMSESMGLSEPVARAVDQAIGVVDDLVREHLSTYVGKEHRG